MKNSGLFAQHAHSAGTARTQQQQSFLYADDPLILIAGNLDHVMARSQGLREIFHEYGEISGYKLIEKECGVVLPAPL